MNTIQTATSWDRTGQFVRVLYLGEYPTAGRVISSRVKYGGTVQHTVELREGLKLPFTSEEKQRLTVDEEQVVCSSIVKE